MLKVNNPLEGGERGDQYLVAARASRNAGHKAAPSTGKMTWLSHVLRRFNVKICSHYPLSKRSLSDMSASRFDVNISLYDSSYKRSLTDF
jgi:hypothetical protein